MTMMSNIRSALLVATLQLSLLAASYVAQRDTCHEYYGVNGTPAGRHRLCSVMLNTGYGTCLDNSSFDTMWETQYCASTNKHICLEECPGIVGMSLTYECSFDGARLYRYKNGEFQYLNGPSVNYSLLLPEHAGLYQCRNSEDHVVYTQNITVNENVRIGGVHCSLSFVWKSNLMCCSATGVWTPETADEYHKYVVYVNPAHNVSVVVEQIEWLVDVETRNDVDIGLYTERDEHNPMIWSLVLSFQRVRFNYPPQMLTSNVPQLLFRLTASDGNYSRSICQELRYLGVSEHSGINVEDTSLPQNISVPTGQDAVFQCKFAYDEQEQGVSDYEVRIDYSKPTTRGNETVMSTCTMYLSFKYQVNRTIGNCTMPAVNKVLTSSNGLSKTVEYTLQIPQVRAIDSKSIVACSVVGYMTNHLQWRKTAYLTVTDPVAPALTAPLIVVTLLLLIVISITTVIAVWVIWKRRKQARVIINQEECPLSERVLRDSEEPGTPDSQSNGTFCMEISETNEVHSDGLLVGEQTLRNGINTNSNEAAIIINDLHRLIGFGGNRLTPPISLQLSRDHNRTIELYDLSEFTEFVVYISYTDQTSEWVRNELKPLIESWHSVIQVNIHENNMIPGFSVSGERHRLILGADKIVIVVSSDYASSEWCVYELEHAIHQKPALCNGRVIPILTEITSCLPSIINGVVCLCVDEDDFGGRLKQAILKKPNIVFD